MAVGTCGPMDHGIVPGAGEHGVRGKSCAACSLMQMLHQRVVHGDSFLLGLQARMHGNAPQCTGGLRLCEQVCDRGMAGFVARMANIERDMHLAGNDVGCAGEGIDMADGGDELFVARSVALDFHNPLCRGYQRVVAQRHGRSAGVVGLSLKRELKARLADDRFDNRKRCIAGFEHRTLFDVDFERSEGGGGQRTGFCDAIGIEAEVADGLRDAYAVDVRAGEMFGSELAGGGERREKRKAEARAFFFSKRDDFDVEWQRSLV